MYCMSEKARIPQYMIDKGDRKENFKNEIGQTINVGDTVMYWHSSAWKTGKVFSIRQKTAYIIPKTKSLEKLEWLMQNWDSPEIGNYESECLSIHQGLIFSYNKGKLAPLWELVNIKSKE